MAERGTVLSTLPRALLAYANQRGANADDLRERAGLAGVDLHGVDTRVRRASVDTLWELIGEALGDPSLGVHLAEVLPPGNAGILEYVALSSATAGEAWAHSVRYWRLLNDEADVRLLHGDDVRIRVRPRVGGPFHPQWVVFTVAVLELSGRRLIEGESGIIDVKLPFARTAHSDALEKLLPCSITHDHDALEVAAPRSFASRPLVSANAMLRDMLVARAELLLAELPADDDILTRARAALDSAMSAGDSSLETLARSLHMSPRSLQRALRDRDTSYREMVDSSRQRTAALMLAREDASISEIAFLLGFSEVAAFHRAFRRWTGVSPGEFRKRATRGT